MNIVIDAKRLMPILSRPMTEEHRNRAMQLLYEIEKKIEAQRSS